MRWRAYLWLLALVCVSVLTMPVASDEFCVDRKDLPLIYKPGEPPVCPTPMLELVPSTIGRPLDTSALELAACAGMMDAMVLVFPDGRIEEDTDGEKYFAAAKARPERPELEVLEEWRLDGRDRAIASLLAPANGRINGDFAHGLGQCSRVYWTWTG